MAAFVARRLGGLRPFWVRHLSAAQTYGCPAFAMADPDQIGKLTWPALGGLAAGWSATAKPSFAGLFPSSTRCSMPPRGFLYPNRRGLLRVSILVLPSLTTAGAVLTSGDSRDAPPLHFRPDKGYSWPISLPRLSSRRAGPNTLLMRVGGDRRQDPRRPRPPGDSPPSDPDERQRLPTSAAMYLLLKIALACLTDFAAANAIAGRCSGPVFRSCH